MFGNQKRYMRLYADNKIAFFDEKDLIRRLKGRTFLLKIASH